MSNLLEICWQHLMSWLKNKLSNLQSFKTNTVLNGDVCWLLFLSLSSGQLWKQNALKNIQPVLGKDQKQIRCQHQLMSVLQERKKQSEMSFSCHASLCVPHLHTRAPGHSTASLPADLDPRPEWDRAVHHCPTPLPKRTDQPLFLQYQDFPPNAPPHWAGSPGEGKEVWFDLTSHSDRVQGEGSPAHPEPLQWMPTQGLAVSGSGRWKPLDLWAVAGHALATLRPILSVCICKTTQTVLG